MFLGIVLSDELSREISLKAPQPSACIVPEANIDEFPLDSISPGVQVIRLAATFEVLKPKINQAYLPGHFLELQERFDFGEGFKTTGQDPVNLFTRLLVYPRSNRQGVDEITEFPCMCYYHSKYPPLLA